MKRMMAAALGLLLVLTACGGKERAPVDAGKLTESLLGQEGLFSDTLEEVDSEVGLALYGIEEADLSEGYFYLSGGATAEELAVLTAPDGDAAERLAQACRMRVERQIEAVRNYQPAEVEKLNNAMVWVDGNVVVLLVSASGTDGGAALDQALEE